MNIPAFLHMPKNGKNAITITVNMNLLFTKAPIHIHF